MDPEDVTLVIPCYDVADTVARALAAVEALEPAPARVLCVDDGSQDGTKELIRRYDVDLVEHERNRGLGATLNTALSHTTTPGLAKIDADIVVEPDWLGSVCELTDAHDAALVQTRFEEEVTTPADKWRKKHPSPAFPDEPRVDEPINGAAVLCRVDPLRDVDGWDETYVRAFDDIDLMLRLADAGYRVYYSPEIVTRHIRTDSWQEVLRTAWAYHYDSLAGRDAPERPAELVRRLPGLLYRSTQCISADLSLEDTDILWISLLRPFYHVKWDVESVYGGNER